MVKMRSLLKKDTVFLWTPEIQAEFDRAKQILTSPMMVKPFDPALRTGLLTDAARLYGLGYILLQWKQGEEEKTRIIQCGSFALTPAQRNYSTIELEFLAIVRAIHKCKFYLHGLEVFKVITDHKPLLGIMSKGSEELDNNRLARLREKVGQYNFEIEWTAGKYHYAADALSRFPIFDAYEDDFEAVLVKTIRSDPRVAVLGEAGAQDDDYLAILAAVRNDAAVEKLPASHPARELKSIWAEIAIISTPKGDVLSYNERLIPPRASRASALAQLHSTHQGLVKTRLAAQSSYFWPGISNDVKTTVEGCQICQKFKPSQPAEKLNSVIQEVSEPMELVSVDIYELKGKNYLVLADAYSGFVAVEELRRITSSEVIKAIEKFCRIPGYPTRIRSDNGRQFVSQECKEFYISRGIVHETSSPEFPSSNGHAESAVKTAKSLHKKCLETGEDFQRALAELRRQPRQDGLVPGDLFLRRKVRGEAPRNPSSEIIEKTSEQIDEQKRKTTRVNESRSELKKLQIGEKVRVQNTKSKIWEKLAIVIAIEDNGRSYVLEDCSDKHAYRRNRIYLRPVPAAGSAVPAGKPVPPAPESAVPVRLAPEPPVPARHAPPESAIPARLAPEPPVPARHAPPLSYAEAARPKCSVSTTGPAPRRSERLRKTREI